MNLLRDSTPSTYRNLDGIEQRERHGHPKRKGTIELPARVNKLRKLANCNEHRFQSFAF